MLLTPNFHWLGLCKETSWRVKSFRVEQSYGRRRWNCTAMAKLLLPIIDISGSPVTGRNVTQFNCSCPSAAVVVPWVGISKFFEIVPKAARFSFSKLTSGAWTCRRQILFNESSCTILSHPSSSPSFNPCVLSRRPRRQTGGGRANRTKL